MADCAECEAIVTNQASAPGHANLVSLGLVRALHLVQRRVSHEAFTCAVCGANWDYLQARGDPASGWTRCDRTAPNGVPGAIKPTLNDAERAA